MQEMMEAGVGDWMRNIREWVTNLFRERKYSLKSYAEKNPLEGIKGLDEEGRITDKWLEGERLKLEKVEKPNEMEKITLRKIREEQMERILDKHYKGEGYPSRRKTM